MRKLLLILLVFVFLFPATACGGGKQEEIPFSIPVKFDTAQKFSEGMARAVKNGVAGYIDTSGSSVFTLDCDTGGDFQEGFAWYSKDGNGGYIDKTGKRIGAEIENFALQGALPFSEGLAVVTSTNGYGTDTYIIDTTGNRNTNFAVLSSSGGYGSVSEGLLRYKPIQGTLWGYKNKMGADVIGQKYLYASDFSCGIAKVQKNDTADIEFIDKSGNTVFSHKGDSFLDAGDCFSDRIVFSDGNKYGYYDKTGEIVIEPEYLAAEDFSDGYAIVKNETGYCIIDTSGTVTHSFSAAESAAANLGGGVFSVKENSKFGLVKFDGSNLLECKYDFISGFSEGYAVVRLKADWGYMKIDIN